MSATLLLEEHTTGQITEEGTFVLHNLRRHTERHRLRVLKDVIREQHRKRVLLTENSGRLARVEHYWGLSLKEGDPYIPHWDGQITDSNPQGIIFGYYLPGTPDFSSLGDTGFLSRTAAEDMAIHRLFELPYEHIRGLLIVRREIGKLQRLMYYLT